MASLRKKNVNHKALKEERENNFWVTGSCAKTNSLLEMYMYELERLTERKRNPNKYYSKLILVFTYSHR